MIRVGKYDADYTAMMETETLTAARTTSVCRVFLGSICRKDFPRNSALQYHTWFLDSRPFYRLNPSSTRMVMMCRISVDGLS